MRKGVILLAGIILLLCMIKNENNRIPQASIRFRVIANSNQEEEQELKKQITENILKEISPSKNFTSILQTRSYLKNNLSTIKNAIDKTLEEKNIEADYKIHYGMNWFPEKVYQNEIYQEGEYESLVITLGEGKGDNFWCVLFPPICFLDKEEDIEYKSWIKEVIDKYF